MEDAPMAHALLVDGVARRGVADPRRDDGEYVARSLGRILLLLWPLGRGLMPYDSAMTMAGPYRTMYGTAVLGRGTGHAECDGAVCCADTQLGSRDISQSVYV